MDDKEVMDLDLELEQELTHDDVQVPEEPIIESNIQLVADEPMDRFEALPRPTAIYLYGVNEMSTEDVKTYAGRPEALQKVEWIDDSSCNLVFDTAEDAKKVAESILIEATDMDHKTLQKAKPFMSDDITCDQLSIRIATDEDIKRQGARERSRYYKIYGIQNEKLPKDKAEARRELIDRMSKNGGDGRSVFERLGNRVTEERPRGRGRRERRSSRSASPIKRDIPDHLKQRLGSRRDDDDK
ncbi:hypothetical protein RMATCC62417_07516 [Rhizopus microsporus]|nr:hypothetical protein RMATCC62417_07516 [Rhizopus microsporus]